MIVYGKRWQVIGNWGDEPFIFNPDFDPMHVVGGARPLSVPFKDVGFMRKYIHIMLSPFHVQYVFNITSNVVFNS